MKGISEKRKGTSESNENRSCPSSCASLFFLAVWWRSFCIVSQLLRRSRSCMKQDHTSYADSHEVFIKKIFFACNWSWNFKCSFTVIRHRTVSWASSAWPKTILNLKNLRKLSTDFTEIQKQPWAKIAQSVQRLAKELDGPGYESRWVTRFSAPVQTGPGDHSVSYIKWYRVFPGGKAAGAWCWPPTPRLAPRLKKFGPSWSVLGWSLLYWNNPQIPYARWVELTIFNFLMTTENHY